MGLTRRDFIKAGVLSLSALATPSFAQSVFKPITRVENPLAYYPNRDWEKNYRNIFTPDSTFHFLCAPNDTHNCLLRASVKNGIVTRIDPSYGYGKATDIYGLKATHRWDPRCCNKGITLMRRFYGGRRIRGPMVRRGFHEWASAGFPRDSETGRPPEKFFQRGQDQWLNVTWDEVSDILARAFINIAETYSGQEGRARLAAQGVYPEPMLDTLEGAGTRTLKFRGSMPFLAVVRYTAPYRMANMMALLDQHVRKVKPAEAKGGRGWDNYAYHTDLAPGHPMTSGQQNVEHDIVLWEHSKLIVLWGMNPFSTKMVDCHWLTEARAKGSKVIIISNDYCPTSRTVDEFILTRTGTDVALAYSVAYTIMKEGIYQEKFVKSFSDMPLLVRMDNGKVLRARDIVPNYRTKPLEKTVVFKQGEKLPPVFLQEKQYIPEQLRDEDMNDFVVWDTKTKAPQVITRDHVGEDFWKLGIDPALKGTYKVTLVDGKTVEVKPLFEVYLQFFGENYTPALVEKITSVPAKTIEALARTMAAHPRQMKLSQGMGVNQYLHGDLKDRAMFMISVLTDNLGRVTGNISSYAGNFRLPLFTGVGQFFIEDPFDVELDPLKPARLKPYWRAESAHYYAHDDCPLFMGEHVITGKSHMPSPTKFIWFVDANSTLGNAKWQYNIIVNTLPKIDCVVTNEWWWSMTCEYSDVVLGVDAWNENKYWDITGSVTNPFVYVWPKRGQPRMFDTKNDVETFALVAKRLSELTGDERFRNYWKFGLEENQEVYVQRVINASSNLKGYDLKAIGDLAEKGIPSLIMTPSYPKIVGLEQTLQSMPWYTKSGRIEFYREEPEFFDAGENIPVYREPVDATFYEPNVIVSKPHPLLRPKTPEEYGVDRQAALLSTELRQARNVLISPEKLPSTKHPLIVTFGATHIVHTPKYRHAAHTTTGDADVTVLLFGPFGDIYRHDPRTPFVSESFIDINPQDLDTMRIRDGDYVWVDADPQDRPFVGWQKRPGDYEVFRLLLRARASNITPPGVGKIPFNMYGSSHGSVKGTSVNEKRLAKNPETGYQSLYRRGSHQSITRAWLKPTLQTESLVRKELIGQVIGKGFAPDVHSPVGAPREGFGKITKAEDGGFGGKGPWRPVALGLRVMSKRSSFEKFLNAKYVQVR